MNLFWKGIAGILVASILVMTIDKWEKDLSMLLTMTVCIMAVTIGLSFFTPVISFMYKLEEIGELQQGVLSILLKISGIGIINELVCMVCRDSGNTSLAHAAKLLGTAMILSLSVPMMETLIDLIRSILGEL